MEVMPMEEDGAAYYRAKEVKEFEETRAGVKGLVDSGIEKLPRFLIHPPESLANSSVADAATTCFRVPVIDFQGCESSRRTEVIKEIREASETWGFFQMVNHGVPVPLMDNMLKAIREFHEQEREVKKEWYSRDSKTRVRYFCNGDLFVSKAANWRDTLLFDFQDGPLNSETFPQICRETVSEYIEHMRKLRERVSELLSEALGLRADWLGSLGCMKRESLVCHYYPPCPQPHLTFGTTKHSDPSSLTLLLQDNVGGLQVLHRDQWVDINPVPGALVANIGDLMQLITNDKFKSVEHRVLAGQVGPRVSAACLLYPREKCRAYGPLEEFTSTIDPPLYRETTISEYLAYYRSKGLDGSKTLPHFRL
ncbi:1-aminocyclopropane-1-carboxylate oxidase homolog 1-like [Neltuma alba]|uniref:1-aminocyclopropane-1-carboxylate oxidase homolog 1-like n=1 Tax=Neltuma alba TaxID=207710 RepID=UPI0010A3B855|nr:1-aminocyclopropane-1-carboxylate oxidase homolog 1-like [Prosopis alba]XP_028791967.1 1-aminocyclopropane-1-carboxylate oxidase homolog 1-like [Prosopis alba]